MKKKTEKEIPAGYVSFNHLKRRPASDKEAKKAYEESRMEYEIIAALIRKRIEKKMTQAQVAKKARMHQSAIARFETGEESPTLETAGRILAAVGAKIKIS